MAQPNPIRGLRRLTDPRIARRLTVHGLAVLLVSFALDVGTSWIMMTLLGVSAEGNVTMRLLYQEWTGQVLVTWLLSQYAWFLFVLLGLLGLLFLALRRRVQDGVSGNVVSLAYRPVVIYGVIFTWVPGVLRYIEGVGSNAAGLLVSFGPYAQIGGGLAVVMVGVFLMVRDFDRQLSQVLLH